MTINYRMLDICVVFFKSSDAYLEQVVHTYSLERDASKTEISEVHKPATLPVLLRLKSYLPLLRQNVLKTVKSPKLHVISLQVQPWVEIKTSQHSSAFLLTRESNKHLLLCILVEQNEGSSPSSFNSSK